MSKKTAHIINIPTNTGKSSALKTQAPKNKKRVLYFYHECAVFGK
jgi:hypothetical protein